MRRPRYVIGWNEYVDIPSWDIRGLRAKVDTGAKSSALHVEDIEVLTHGEVSFNVILHRKKRSRRIHVQTRIVRRARVRSSSGEFATRIFVAVPLVLGPVHKEIEMSLVDRSGMIYRMLLGRTALETDFLVDVASRGLLTARPVVVKVSKRKAKKKAKRKVQNAKKRRSVRAD